MLAPCKSSTQGTPEDRTGHLQPALQLRRMLSHGGSIQQRLQNVTPKSRDEPACRRQGNGSTPSFHSHCTYTLSEEEPLGSITDGVQRKACRPTKSAAFVLQLNS